MKEILKLIRPQQWVKNLFVFIPAFFGGGLLDADRMLSALLTFFSFSFAASSIYCLNDIADLEADRKHPVKCHRPIASGAVSVAQAYSLMALFFFLSMAVALLFFYPSFFIFHLSFEFCSLR